MLSVVINVHTDELAALALASLERRSNLPMLLVNCEPTAASRELFAALAKRWDRLEVREAPIRYHGDALDGLCRELDVDVALFLDSDAEILDDRLVPERLSHFSDPQVFGAGFTRGPEWLGKRQGALDRVGLLQERPWMPFAAFSLAHVREALDAGKTFRDYTYWNDFALSQRVSFHMAKRLQDIFTPKSQAIARLPSTVRARIRGTRLPWLAWARRDFYGLRPNYVVYDTGADLYQWLKYERGLVFAGYDMRLSVAQVSHHHGATRALVEKTPQNASTPDAADVRRRLRDVYNLDIA